MFKNLKGFHFPLCAKHIICSPVILRGDFNFTPRVWIAWYNHESLNHFLCTWAFYAIHTGEYKYTLSINIKLKAGINNVLGFCQRLVCQMVEPLWKPWFFWETFLWNVHHKNGHLPTTEVSTSWDIDIQHIRFAGKFLNGLKYSAQREQNFQR